MQTPIRRNINVVFEGDNFMIDGLRLSQIQEFNKSIIEKIENLSAVNRLLKNLNDDKAMLEASIAEDLNHHELGQKTYHINDDYTVVVVSGFNYCVDKFAYEAIKNKSALRFNPVREKMTYTVDKTVVKEAKKYANTQELLLLSEIISEVPTKLSVKITTPGE